MTLTNKALKTLWWYRPWHFVKFLYCEGDVVKCEWHGRIVIGCLYSAKLWRMHAAARRGGVAIGRFEIMLVDPDLRIVQRIRAARMLLLAAVAVLVRRRGYSGVCKAIRLLVLQERDWGTAPRRVRLSRTKGFPLPPDTISVARPHGSDVEECTTCGNWWLADLPMCPGCGVLREYTEPPNDPLVGAVAPSDDHRVLP